ncbi:hypothetical protein ITJ69_17735 [Curtobacterium sp. VKM Ac-2887]|nr:hypothetical protein [Curtobacterium sp. VKM Ac-2887]
MHDVLPYLPALSFAAVSITTTVCVTVVKLRPYREARRFGDVALKSSGKKERARIARSLARDYARRRDRGSARSKKKKKKRHAG